MKNDLKEEKLDLITPELEYLSSHYIVSLPYNDKHLKDKWKLRLYAAKLVERRLGDEVQLTSLKLKKPSPISRATSKVTGKVPNAQLYVTIKF